HTRFSRDWSSDVCSSDLFEGLLKPFAALLGDEHDGHYGAHIASSICASGRAGLMPCRGKREEACLDGFAAELAAFAFGEAAPNRSEERRVGKGGRSGGWA